MLRNLASSLFLTERDEEVDELGREYVDFSAPNKPKVKGRIVTTLPKAKEARRLVERCITIAKKGIQAEEQAEQYATGAERQSDAWKDWRNSDEWLQWNQAMAPAVAARRRCIQLLGNRHAVEILFDTVAERFTDRPGGYTRILRLSKPRLGDAGQQAILEFVGKHDRVRQKSERPAFEDDERAAEEESPSAETEPEEPSDTEQPAAEESDASADADAAQTPAEEEKKEEA
jgi:large subunit ribosomal protein L17